MTALLRYLATQLGSLFAALLIVHAWARVHAEPLVYAAGLCGGFFLSAVFPLWVTP